jgi:gliding motility-associated-like protein
MTPNADGVNDLFLPVERIGIASARLIIYNRWGNTVFATTDLVQGWNCLIDGVPAPEGSYYWTVRYTTIFDDLFSDQGHFHLLR